MSLKSRNIMINKQIVVLTIKIYIYIHTSYLRGNKRLKERTFKNCTLHFFKDNVAS